MMINGLTLAEISHVIGLATAPAFLLGGVIGFISLLHAQLGRILDRARALHASTATAIGANELEAELARYERRSKLLTGSVQFAVIAGVATALLIILAFVGALAKINVEILVALLFITSLSFFVAALVQFGRETAISLGVSDYR
jgi:hypothetical protein